MLIINSTSSNPCYNLAAEEYLLRQSKEDVFMLYINEPSIIVGKHQNTMAEINYSYTRNNNIKIVRRISGGGTVYHDAGNLNFSFILNGTEGKLIDFERYTQPIIELLNRLHIPARFKEHNNICVNGIKISGNAEHVYKNRVLHHGTILFNSELNKLEEAIRVKPDKYIDRAVKSRRSEVTNISGFLPKSFTIQEFRELVIAFIHKSTPDTTDYNFTDIDHNAILELIYKKYATWEWNFGYSPNYVLENEFFISEGDKISITMSVEKGVIASLKFNHKNNDDKHNFLRLEEALKGLPHQEKILTDVIYEMDFNTLLPSIDLETLIANLF